MSISVYYLLFQCQLSKSHGGLSGSVAYICAGEGQFPIKRLTELADHYERKYSLTDMLANVHVMQCYNIDDALSVLVGSSRPLIMSFRHALYIHICMLMVIIEQGYNYIQWTFPLLSSPLLYSHCKCTVDCKLS